MANDLMKAADDARRLLRGFKAFEEVAAALDAAGSVVQQQAEAEQALQALRPQIEAAKAELAQAELAALTQRDQAGQFSRSAQDEAAAMLRAATDEAHSIAAAAQDALATARQQATALIEEARQRAAEMSLRTESLRSEAQDLEERIARAQAHINKLLG